MIHSWKSPSIKNKVIVTAVEDHKGLLGSDETDEVAEAQEDDNARAAATTSKTRMETLGQRPASLSPFLE